MYILCTSLQERYLSFTIFFFLIHLSCLAQRNTINAQPNDYLLSIKTDSSNIKDRQLQIQALEAHIPDSAIVQYWYTYKESVKIGYHSGTARALKRLGILYFKKEIFDSARSCLETAKVYLKKCGEMEDLFEPLVFLGHINGYRAQYELALDCYYEAIAMLRQYPPQRLKFHLFKTQYHIALTWMQLGNTQRAKEVLSLLKMMADKSNDPWQQLLYNSVMARIYAPINITKCLYYYNIARSYVDPKIPAETIFELYNNLAQSHLKSGDIDSAQYYTDQVFKLEQQYPTADNRQIQIMHSWDNLAHIYHSQGKYTEAEEIWNSVKNEALQKGFVDLFLQIAPYIANNYNTMGQPQKAYDLLLNYTTFQDSVFNFQKSQATEYWLQSHLTKKNKIVLEHKLRLHQQNALIRTKNFWIGGSILTALCLVALLVIIIASYRHRQKLQAASMDQLQQHQEINQLRAQVRGEEQERNRIAIELHDGIASELWGIKLHIGCVQEEEQAGGWEQDRWAPIYNQLHQAIQRVRTTAHNLMPDLLLEEGLAPALDTLCKRMKTQTGILIDFQLYGPIVRTIEEVELSLYRMVQELIQNALKHATGADQLLVQLSANDHMLNITVEDNGVGFAVNESWHRSGFGLVNIKKRVAALQGHFELKSEPGEGTTVYLEFDLRHLL